MDWDNGHGNKVIFSAHLFVAIKKNNFNPYSLIILCMYGPGKLEGLVLYE